MVSKKSKSHIRTSTIWLRPTPSQGQSTIQPITKQPNFSVDDASESRRIFEEVLIRKREDQGLLPIHRLGWQSREPYHHEIGTLALQTRLSPGRFLHWHTAKGRDGAPFARGRESRLSGPTVSQGLQRTGNPPRPQAKAIFPNVAPTDTNLPTIAPPILPSLSTESPTPWIRHSTLSFHTLIPHSQEALFSLPVTRSIVTV